MNFRNYFLIGEKVWRLFWVKPNNISWFTGQKTSRNFFPFLVNESLNLNWIHLYSTIFTTFVKIHHRCPRLFVPGIGIIVPCPAELCCSSFQFRGTGRNTILKLSGERGTGTEQIFKISAERGTGTAHTGQNCADPCLVLYNIPLQTKRLSH